MLFPFYYANETVTLFQKNVLLQRKPSVPCSLEFETCLNADQKNLTRGEERIRLCEQRLLLTVDGDLRGRMFDSKQQTDAPVIDRLQAPVFSSVLWFRRFRKIGHEAGPSHLV